MKFHDIAVFRDARFTLGIEQESGRHYLSIPVGNSIVDYDEYYALDPGMFDAYLNDPQRALAFVERCRLRQEDTRLLVPPGMRRGSAM